MTGRRRRRPQGTVLEIFCDSHPTPVMLLRPAWDSRGLSMTGNQNNTVARATNHGTEPGTGARLQLVPPCHVCGAKPNWRAEKMLALLAELPSGVWQVNLHELDTLISQPELAADYLKQRDLLK
jgi:hypothetical protein